MSDLVFFSYSRTEQTFAITLANELRKVGINVWIDQLDIEPGKEWDLEVEKALKRSGCVHFIASEASVSSKNVLDEVNYALKKRKKVIPIIKSLLFVKISN